jgi:hypothetical protein
VHCELTGQACTVQGNWTQLVWADPAGTETTHDFAALAYAVSWMLEQPGDSPLGGLRHLQVADFTAGQRGELQWLELPVAGMAENAGGHWIVVITNTGLAADGPWFVHSAEALAEGEAPYLYACSELEDAGRLARLGRGGIYHWQTTLEFIFADCYSLSATIDDFEPSTPPDAVIIPGSDDELLLDQGGEE